MLNNDALKESQALLNEPLLKPDAGVTTASSNDTVLDFQKTKDDKNPISFQLKNLN